ncbi:two pore domain potassium channel family protein [Candidatus Woesearchaeota archaeon]|nr:two pore domain potassium channel family protein [Candidatus Woesearchaeota archaeon]
MPTKTILRGLAATAALLVTGTAFYSATEGLSAVDAFYFAGATLTTLGYGDIVPTTDVSKVFTVFYALAGIGVIFYVFGKIVHIFCTKSFAPRKR